jgi:hypothetical protein
MHAVITFPENTTGTKAVDSLKNFQVINPIKGFQRFIEKSDWDERLLGYEKHMNLFSWVGIAASDIFFVPLCISIFTR